MTDQVQTLLDRYAEALRARDLDAVMACYADVAVVQAPEAPTATGPEVRELYRAIFGALTLDIAFTIESTVESGDGTVAVFTHSTGQQTDVASGASSAESNREAFVLVPAGDGLSITRYLFNVAAG
jgi:ketosteroid isomerase-like protein